MMCGNPLCREVGNGNSGHYCRIASAEVPILQSRITAGVFPLCLTLPPLTMKSIFASWAPSDTKTSGMSHCRTYVAGSLPQAIALMLCSHQNLIGIIFCPDLRSSILGGRGDFRCILSTMTQFVCDLLRPFVNAPPTIRAPLFF